MSCSEFIDRFSDYFDGVGDADFSKYAEAHLAGCASCRRYVEVVRQGRELIRGAQPVSVARDFYPRLRHRIYHMEDAEALARSSVGSATSAATILGIAILLTMVAWSPLMLSRPQVELAPIVVSRPSAERPFGLKPPPVSFPASATDLRYSRGFRRNADLWQHPHSLLLRHSTLLERYGPNGAFRLTALD